MPTGPWPNAPSDPCLPVSILVPRNALLLTIQFNLPDKSGGLNGSMQHSSRTRLALETKPKSLVRVKSAGTLPWLGFDRVQSNGSFSRGSIVESMYWMVLHRPVELAALIGTLPLTVSIDMCILGQEG
jgi:hypothetical protein